MSNLDEWFDQSDIDVVLEEARHILKYIYKNDEDVKKACEGLSDMEIILLGWKIYKKMYEKQFVNKP